jgi:hypothetical protein
VWQLPERWNQMQMQTPCEVGRVRCLLLLLLAYWSQGQGTGKVVQRPHARWLMCERVTVLGKWVEEQQWS